MTQTTSLTVIHTSDWHLGHELNSHGREAEHDLFLDWLLGQIGEHGADALLVTGDVYDVANPPVAAMRRLFAFLNAATARYPQLQILILGGNHDSAMRIDLPAALLGEGRVHFAGALPRRDGAPDFERMLLPLHDAAGQTAAWLAAVPFCRPGDLGTHTLSTLYDAALEAGSARAGALPLIVTGHLHVAGGDVSEMSERRIVVGGEEAQAASLFDARAAYVALGHLHRPQQIAAETQVRYAGSPFPLSSTERGYRHSISVVRLGHGSCEIELVEIPRPAAFLSIGPAPLDAVVRQIEALELDAEVPAALWPFIEITVAVEGPEPHLQTRVLGALEGKPVRLARLGRTIVAAAGAAPPGTVLDDLADLKPEAVFSALFARAYEGASPPDDLARAFAELLVETETAPETTGEPA